MKFHLLTAITRPRNLPAMASALAVAGHGYDVSWHWRWDLDREHVGGQQLKNDMLDGITDGWVWIYDDDTLIHPNLLNRVASLASHDPPIDAVVVCQDVAGMIRRAGPDYAKVGLIDAGQAVLRRSLIGDHRLPRTYEGDGQLLQQLLLPPANVTYTDEVLSYYNALGVPA